MNLISNGWFIDAVRKQLGDHIHMEGTELYHSLARGSAPRFPLSNQEYLEKRGRQSMDFVSIHGPENTDESMFQTADQLVKDDGIIYFASEVFENTDAIMWFLKHGYHIVFIHRFQDMRINYSVIYTVNYFKQGQT